MIPPPFVASPLPPQRLLSAEAAEIPLTIDRVLLKLLLVKVVDDESLG